MSSPSPSPVPSSSSSHSPTAALAAFKSWFTSISGHLHPAVDFTYSDSAGVTLRVRPDFVGTFPAGTLVIGCPHEASLSALNAVGAGALRGRKWPGDVYADGGEREGMEAGYAGLELPEILHKEARPQFVAAVWIAVQYLLGDRSRWSAYFDVLPGLPNSNPNAFSTTEKRGLGELDTPLWWSTEEREWLQGTNLAKGVADLEGMWEAEWARWEDVVGKWAKGKGLSVTW